MSEARPLSSLFLPHVKAPADPSWVAGGALEERLQQLLDAGRAAWPDIKNSPSQFIPYLAERLPADEDLAASLLAAHADDLYLACGCVAALPGALQAFDERFLSQVPAFLAGLRPPPFFVDEVRQVLREKLLLGRRSAEEAPAPRLAEYSGRGTLRGWLRITALRTARSLVRNKDEQHDHRDGDEVLRLVAGAQSPETDYLRGRYQPELRQAIRAAIATLPLEQRNLLRLHFMDGLRLEQIGALFQVNKSTISRWLASAREAILAETRRLMFERMGTSAAELDGLMAQLQSQLEVSIAEVLEDAPGS